MKARLLSALNSLKTTILTQIRLLVMAGMMLINVAMMSLPPLEGISGTK
jgi:hypothetical protein